MRVLTVGHSNRAFPEFVDLLRAHGVRRLVDVRRHPRSRFVPWTNAETLGPALEGVGIAYTHAPDLGGKRAPVGDAVNAGLGNGMLRGYADHMRSLAFHAGVDALLRAARRTLTAVMCAEADPAQCHRRLLADALATRGVDVRHVLSEAEAVPHALSEHARVTGGVVTYPDPQARLDVA